MKRASFAGLFVLAFGCSSSESSLPIGAEDSGTSGGDTADTAADAATTDDTTPPADTAKPSYEEAVLASTWIELPKGPKVSGGAKQDDIFFTSPSRGFLVSGPAAAIYRTDDGGDTWKKLFTHSGTYFRSVLFADDNHGFASNLGVLDGSGITDTNVLYETKDGGDSWAALPTTAITGPMPSGICNQTKIDATHLIAVGRVNGPAHFMSSSDAGASWTSVDLSAQLSMLIDTRFTTPMDGLVVGGTVDSPMKCTVLHTSDGGATWTSVFTSKVRGSLCWKMSFPSENVGYVSVQDMTSGPATFLKTSDGGKTWSEKPLGPTSAYGGIGMGFITENIGWVASENPKQPVYRTTDGGETWVADEVLKSPINRFRFVDLNTAYAVGASVWKLNVITR